MTKAETLKFLNKIKAYYYNFSIEDNVKEEWIEKLKSYDLQDLEMKFEEHLNGQYALEPPRLHFLTRYLKTKEEKERATSDYLIRCNLCGNEMYLSEYENKHYSKCLLIKALVSILKSKGEEVTYETLEEYDMNTLERVYNKHTKPNKDLSKLLKVKQND